MSMLNKIYKCQVCGQIATILHPTDPDIHCCGIPMNMLSANTEDAAQEKHVPVVESVDGGIKVQVGEILHPMEDAHYIEWIEVRAGNKVYRKFLSPGEVPEAAFALTGSNIVVKAYCNLHGLWRG